MSNKTSTVAIVHRDADCLADIVLDEIVAGDCHEQAYASHLASCENCKTRLQTFKDFKQIARPDVERMVLVAKRQIKEKHQGNKYFKLSFSWPKLLIATATAVACVMLTLRVDFAQLQLGPNDNNTIRIKGTNLRFFVQRKGEVMPGRSGEIYHAGDALRFVVSNGNPTYFMLVGIEASGKATSYFPYHGTSSVKLEAGIDVPLPGSLVLDAAKETEYYLGVFTTKPISIDTISRKLDASASAANAMEERLNAVDLPGQHHLIIIRRE